MISSEPAWCLDPIALPESNILRYWDGGVWTGWVSFPGGEPIELEIPESLLYDFTPPKFSFEEILRQQQAEINKANRKAKTAKFALGTISFLEGVHERKIQDENKQIHQAALHRAERQNYRYKKRNSWF